MGSLSTDPTALPAPVRDSIKNTFGAELSAEEVVRRVLHDVRSEGDAAVHRYTVAFDRAKVTQLRVEQAFLQRIRNGAGQEMGCGAFHFVEDAMQMKGDYRAKFFGGTGSCTSRFLEVGDQAV